MPISNLSMTFLPLSPGNCFIMTHKIAVIIIKYILNVFFCKSLFTNDR